MASYRIRESVVREAADAKGDTTIRSIARRTGIHHITLTGLLNGRLKTGLHTAMRLSEHYGPSVNDIVEEVDEADDDTSAVAA